MWYKDVYKLIGAFPLIHEFYTTCVVSICCENVANLN